MAREAGYCELSATLPPIDNFLKRFAELIRADERAACAKVAEELHPGLSSTRVAESIRARSNT
jgi:hypothetical protein